MKSLFRNYLYHAFSLWAITQVMQGSFKIQGTLENFLLASLILTFLNLLLKPILKLLFFPINSLTMGLFSLVINTLIFLLFLKIIPVISIAPWQTPAFVFRGFSIASLKLDYYGSLFVASTLVSLITNFLIFLVK